MKSKATELKMKMKEKDENDGVKGTQFILSDERHLLLILTSNTFFLERKTFISY